MARNAGLSKHALCGLREVGRIETLGRGLNRQADAEPADLDLLAIAVKAPKATLCLGSGLEGLPHVRLCSIDKSRRGICDAVPLSYRASLRVVDEAIVAVGASGLSPAGVTRATRTAVWPAPWCRAVCSRVFRDFLRPR